MRRRLGWGLAAGWVVLAGVGWGASQWLGEPAATSGPAPVSPPSSAADPGPQPEFDCAEAMRATPGPAASAGGRSRQVTCDFAVVER
ncbi:hypothetical protein [Streptomyces sp. SID9727]|uniref:hypothetical protein n=1 Tax=Streptomyces sp. SID9727 TaxID=2706114 RepID=UPI0013C9FDBD|nr:hypothetical protein [Streptomyces sp. SID9727]NEC68308.1 hypothetical protein [Streptomyces sp. SID9727]